MKQKIHCPKKISIRIPFFWITIFLITLTVILTLNHIGNKILPGATITAELELKKFASRIINSVIQEELKNQNLDNLFLITKDKNDYIQTIDYNPIVVNQILSKIVSKTETLLRNVEKGKNLFELSSDILDTYDIEKLKKGIIFELVPSVIFNNPLLINIGPTIPVKISMLGSIEGYINTRVTNYGINNALVEMVINIEMTLKIVLPYRTKDVILQNEIPISTKLIQGSIPNYYFQGFDKNSGTYLLPVE